MEKQWIWADPLAEDIERELSRYSSIAKQILFARNISSSQEAEAFLNLELNQPTDPYLLKGMGAAVRRINEALQRGEKVAIYGDYDADGVTGTALLMRVLSALGFMPQYYIPHRLDEGYGLNREALKLIKARGADLVITVDCGIRAIDPVREANKEGLDLIITDHHEPGTEIPEAIAVINPKQPGDDYPFKGLAGVGLAYKLAQGIQNDRGRPLDVPMLELVAIGTVADLAPLQGENRNLVAKGLKELNQTSSVGLEALIKKARLSLGSIGSTNIAFGLGPRINAAGRLDVANKAVELLLTQDTARAADLADRMEKINSKRQAMTRDVVERAREQLGDTPVGKVIFAGDEGFHEGIVGLAASRLVDEFYRPSIVASMGEEVTKASARSIPGFNITSALEANKDLLVRFGGHAAAAGFVVETKKVDELRIRLDTYAAENFGDIDLKPSVEIDAQVKLVQLDWPLLEFIERLEPCGEGNRLPLFGARRVRVMSSRQVGKEGAHLKLVLEQERKIFDAIAFRMGSVKDGLPSIVDVAFNFEKNVYMGTENLQLNVRALRGSREEVTPDEN